MLKKIKSFFLVINCLALTGACAPAPVLPELNVVPSVEIERFLGTWYEVGGIPTPEQNGCIGTTATYSLRDNGDIDVLNQCYLNAAGTRTQQARGRAFVPDPKQPTRLKVEFFWPFAGDYQIMALADDYSSAMIGNPQRRFLWILSREASLPEARYQELVDLAVAQGYDAGKIQRTPALASNTPG